jgi:adenine C2-methylase RlmN of 23S rRNA A2503 and tRNA A37
MVVRICNPKTQDVSQKDREFQKQRGYRYGSRSRAKQHKTAGTLKLLTRKLLPGYLYKVYMKYKLQGVSLCMYTNIPKSETLLGPNISGKG